MTQLPPPVTPCLVPAAKQLTEATDPRPEQGRQILLGLQSFGRWVLAHGAEHGLDTSRVAVTDASLDDLKGLPRTLVITDEADVLRDEGERYADKLRRAGVDVTSVRVAGMVHDLLLLDSLRDTRAAHVARHLAVDALKTALH